MFNYTDTTITRKVGVEIHSNTIKRCLRSWDQELSGKYNPFEPLRLIIEAGVTSECYNNIVITRKQYV